MKNLIIALLLISTSAIGQEFNFDIHNTSLSEYLETEAKLGSERIETTSNHVSYSGEAQPIKFLRKEEVLPDLTVYYFFKKADSAMSNIRYEWDVYNFEKQQNNQKSEKFEKALIDKYESLKNEISDSFGQPEIRKNYSNISRLDSINTFVESSTWKPNDSTEIKMHATVSNYYEKRGASTINPTHRIRLYVRNRAKRKEMPAQKLDKNKISQLEQIKSSFFLALKTKDLKKVKEYLSDIILEKVTDEQITTLIDNISFEKETELIYSGIQMGLNGSSFTVLQYKYSDDSSSPPSEMIKLMFDENDKVVGIQPVVMQKLTNE